jgi:hypothetical protein
LIVRVKFVAQCHHFLLKKAKMYTNTYIYIHIFTVTFYNCNIIYRYI